MASAASTAPGADDSGRRRHRLAASLQISPRPSPWRPSAGLGPNPLEPAPASSTVNSEGGGRPLASAPAGDSGPRAGARVRIPRAAQARENLGERTGQSPRVSVGPAGDVPKAARHLGLQLKDLPPSEAVALLTKYTASLGISLIFREDQMAGEARGAWDSSLFPANPR